MFGEHAASLLKMMGHSGTVPSALLARDIPSALQRLERELAAAEPPGTQSEREDEEGQPVVALRKRAWPLIELLRASAREDADVMWDRGQPIP
jgi:hypothetical protein